jgi:glycine dehydrogenase
MNPVNEQKAFSMDYGFVSRHVGPSADDIADMLKIVNAQTLDQLMRETLPDVIRQQLPLVSMGEALSEPDALSRLAELADKNQLHTSLIGQGYYGTILPAVIQRNVLENPAWYTAYTPYQPEISQGRLEALLNFQTMVCELTGLDVANASLLDEATAAAEAMSVAERVAKNKVCSFFVDQQCHPQTIAVIRTRAEPLGWKVIVGDPHQDLDVKQVFGAIFQYPGSDGAIRDFSLPIRELKAAGAVSVMAADPLALVLLKTPGALGADIAVGSMQRFGVPMGYGGPHAGYMAVRDEIKRALPGRIVGVSVDSRGQPAFRLSLQTREQHIRREKATSNICTAQVLLAVIASMYAIYHGPEGLLAIARKVHQRTVVLALGLRQLGFVLEHAHFFDTITLEVGDQRDELLRRAQLASINLRIIDSHRVGISLDESTTAAIVEKVWTIFGGVFSYIEIEAGAIDHIPDSALRLDACLKHPVFKRYHSETELLRYMRKLADRDLALDRAMIPLGSCTMKLNATSEMIPITWPGFSGLHPFAPLEQAQGYQELFDDLSRWLAEITGYDAISLQPNSGAQGEYAGLLAIRAYHRSRGEGQRTVCLIPSSAHGTNPASAQMVGMRVVIVACDAKGNVDIEDLRSKAEKHSAELAALMITYPSTHGVFEEHIRTLCDVVHANGGQVYLDGANLNAQVGLARPGDYGADVSHLNLHKTFCIPHGGGGPGMGPIGVKSHLAPFLPGHLVTNQTFTVGPVSAAPYGSASILPISYAYILMMGGKGLKHATEVAILNANYIACRLATCYPVLYQNHNGRVAHECIIDTRVFKDSCGVTVDDIAKRLIDYGFHAPTMSFPVPGTLMIEPTESESQSELDRFCDAMLAIHAEIVAIENGDISLEDSALRHAPHTTHDLISENWQRKYSRESAVFPKKALRQDKYWPPVGRVDNAYGDRNLVCICPPLTEYV